MRLAGPGERIEGPPATARPSLEAGGWQLPAGGAATWTYRVPPSLAEARTLRVQVDGSPTRVRLQVRTGTFLTPRMERVPASDGGEPGCCVASFELPASWLAHLPGRRLHLVVEASPTKASRVEGLTFVAPDPGAAPVLDERAK